MPLFFFHYRDDENVVRDTRGMFLPDEEATWYQAFRTANALVSDISNLNFKRLNPAVQVEDDRGRPVLTMPISDFPGLTG